MDGLMAAERSSLTVNAADVAVGSSLNSGSDHEDYTPTGDGVLIGELAKSPGVSSW
jgi:hypothetical protein